MMLARFLGRAERELGALRILAGQGDEDRGGVRFASLNSPLPLSALSPPALRITT